MVEMIIDEDISRMLAAREGLPLDFIVKEMYLMELLGSLSAKGLLSDLIFKGGTALNKIYLSKDYRFSEDLDFDFVGKSWNGNTERLRKASESFEGTESRRFRGGKILQIDYVYRTPRGKADRVRIDINLDARTETAEKVVEKTVESRFINSVVAGVKTYAFEDLLARKMSALRDRAEGKDIFDVSNALEIARKSMLVRSIGVLVGSRRGDKKARQFIEDTIKRVRSVDPRLARNLTNPYIPIGSRPSDWYMLIESLVASLEKLADSINE